VHVDKSSCGKKYEEKQAHTLSMLFPWDLLPAPPTPNIDRYTLILHTGESG